MEILKNEVFAKEVRIGDLKIELSIVEKDGCRVTLTAKDIENRRIWRTELTDEEGHVNVYRNRQEAISEANKKLRSMLYGK